MKNTKFEILITSGQRVEGNGRSTQGASDKQNLKRIVTHLYLAVYIPTYLAISICSLLQDLTICNGRSWLNSL